MVRKNNTKGKKTRQHQHHNIFVWGGGMIQSDTAVKKKEGKSSIYLRQTFVGVSAPLMKVTSTIRMFRQKQSTAVNKVKPCQQQQRHHHHHPRSHRPGSLIPCPGAPGRAPPATAPPSPGTRGKFRGFFPPLPRRPREPPSTRPWERS